MGVLQSLGILDTPPEQGFDDLVEMAAAICGVPISLVSFVAGDRQWFKAEKGLGRRETTRDQSFCAYTLEQKHILIIPDTRDDPRFRDNPLVTGEPGIRFYAGAPIVEKNGYALGTVCVIDKQPRSLSPQQIAALEALARQAVNLLEQRSVAVEKAEYANEAIRAMQSAERSREQLQIALDSADLAAWHYDPVRGTVSGDGRMAQFFGLEVPEAPAGQWLAAIVEEDRARVGEEFAASLGGAPYNTRYRVQVAGELRWLHARAKHASLPDGSVGLTGICEDITREESLAATLAEIEGQLQVEREKSAEQLRLESERLEMSLTTSNATSFDWTPATDVVRWSGLAPFGVDPEAIPTGASSFEYVHPEDRAGLSEALQQALKSGQSYVHEYRGLWADGSVRWVRTAGRVVPDSDGSVRFLGVNIDITDRKLAEQALLHTEKLSAVGRMASVISHEINNPLEAITNLLYIVRASGQLSQEDRDHLDIADRELARISQIAAQTLRFHRNIHTPSAIDATVLVREVLSLYGTRLSASNIEVKLDLRRDISFHAYEGDLRQALNNLIGNAFDAMRNGGILRIRTRRATDPRTGRKGVGILVADNGQGISAEVRKNIFEAFFSTKGIHGSGLGLWISRRILHKHQGHLTFRTATGLHHGSVFRLWVPLQAAASAMEGWA